MPTEKTSLKLYKDTVLIDFYPTSHRYKLKGEKKWLTSVTAATGIINKPFLIPWAVGLARDHLIEMIERGTPITHDDVRKACDLHSVKKEEAANIGSLVHAYAERYAKTRQLWSDEKNEKVLLGIGAFLEWVEEHDVTFLKSESLCYSKEHNFVGTFDALAEVDGKLSLVDYKTSSGIYPEYSIQASAYALALVEEYDLPIEQTVIVRFDKETGKLETLEEEEFGPYQDTFLNCLALKRAL